MTDVRHAIRSLRRTSGFALIAVATLGLGMALCTTPIVVAKAYLLTGLPYPESDRLYWVRYSAPGQETPRSMEALDWASLGDVIEHPIAWDLDMFYLLGGEQAESAPGAWVTRGFIEGLGIRPAIGRGFDDEAFAPGGANVALISHRLWISRFGGDAHVAGRTFTAYVSDRPEEAETFTIIGVLPAGFWHLNAYTDIIAPLREPTYPYMVRLRPGVAPEQAQARISSLLRAGAHNVPEEWRVEIVSSHDAYVAGVRPMIGFVTAAAALVFLVACANVAGLMLVRAIRRQNEIAIRTALGAGASAIMRMLFAEAVVLVGASTLLALLVTDLALSALGPQVQQRLGRPAPGGPHAFALDAETIAITAALGLIAVVVCALASLSGSMRRGLVTAAQGGGRTATESRRSGRIRAGLIAVEIAASLALLAGSTLMLRTVVSLLHVDLGFRAERVLYASVTLRQSRYPDAPARLAVFDRMVSRLDTIPGAQSVALTTAWPLQPPRLHPVTAGAGSESATTRAAVHAVSGNYFATLGIPLAAGRAFTRTEVHGSEPVAIVSDSLARRLWPTGGALGSRLVVPQQEDGAPVEVTRVVVGVAADVRQAPEDQDLADVYIPLLQAPGRFAFAMMRTAGSPADWVAPFRAAFRDIDSEIALNRVAFLQTAVDRNVAQPRFLATLLVAFASAAALVALVGVYGLIAYAVRQREREIAVRIAVGADPAHVTRLFLREGATILLAGLALGVLGALAAGRLIEAQLFGVTPRDPVALLLALGVFALAGFLAIWWPSRRAALTDPAIALRVE